MEWALLSPPSSPSNRWVCRWSWKEEEEEFVSRVQIQLVCHPLCRGDIPPRRRMDAWTDGWSWLPRMLTETVLRPLEQKKGRSGCGANFAFSFWALSLILTFPMPSEEALRLKGHRRSPPFPLMVLPPSPLHKYSPLAMHTYAPTFSVGNFCLSVVCIQ